MTTAQSKFGDLNSDKQILFLVQWFAEFSEFQRKDFLNDHLCLIYRNFFQQNLFNSTDDEEKELVKQNGSTLTNEETNELNNDESLKLANNMDESLKLSKKPPSIFECRMKLFKEWFNEQWNDQDRIEFLLRLKNVDSEFVMDFYRLLFSQQNLLDCSKLQTVIDNGDDNHKRLIERLDMMNAAIFTEKSNKLESQYLIDLTAVNGICSSKSKPDLLANCHNTQQQPPPQQQSNDDDGSNGQKEDLITANDNDVVDDKTPDLLA